MRWWKRRGSTAPPGAHAGLTWAVGESPDGRTLVEVAVSAADPDIPYPHLTALVLRSPCTAPLPPGWHALASLRGGLEDGDQVEVLADLLLAAPTTNLAPGGRFAADLPVRPDEVDGVVLGSLTNRLWVETRQGHLWVVDHGRGPRLGDWSAHAGSDPWVRRHRLVVAAGPPHLEHVEDVRLRDLQERDPGR